VDIVLTLFSSTSAEHEIAFEELLLLLLLLLLFLTLH